MDKRTQIKNELVEKLKTISQDREFILSVINHAKHDDDRKEIIKYIDKGEDVSYEQLLLLSIWLCNQREKI